MRKYRKQILSINQQVQTYVMSGMKISSDHEEVREALINIGYYRLRGYCFQ